MAFDVPVPRSYQATLGDILATFQARYGISRLKIGGAILTAFEAAAQSDVRATQDVFNTLDLEDTSRLRGSALEFKARSEGLDRQPASPSSGKVQVSDVRFNKISTRIYSGTPPIPAGSIVLRIASAVAFPSTGTVYVGRGTVNSEGPLAYTAKTLVGQYWQLTLSSATQKFHNINEEVVVGQGGNRLIPVGTVCGTARDGRTTPVDFQTTSQAIILDGETIVRNVPVICRQPGTIGNVPYAAIKTLPSPPFPGASVTNLNGFDNGFDVESDDDLVDRLRKAKASKSRGTETAILYNTRGVFSTEESKRVISASLVRPAGEPATLFIDDGTGYEELNVGIANDILTDSAAGGEQYFSLTSRRPIAKAFIKSTAIGPFSLEDGCILAVLVGGTLNEHTFNSDDFIALSAASAQEIVSSINSNPDIDFSARTADGGTRVVIFARADTGEDLQVVQPESGNDANDFLIFSTSPTFTLKLYKNDILLYKDGREAVITGTAQALWTSMSDGIQLTVAVDGTPAVVYTFNDEDFVDNETGFTSVSQTNSVDAWVTVINAKIPGITAENGGGFIVLKSNRGRKSTASIVLSAPGGANLISAGMFTSTLGLTASGLNRDYTLDRMTGQIKLSVPLAAGDSLTVGSTNTRGYLQSFKHATAAITLNTNGRLWVGVNAEARKLRVNTSATTTYDVTSTSTITTYTASDATAFGTTESLLQVGDYVIIWDAALNAHGCFRICEVSDVADFDYFKIERPQTDDQSAVTLASGGMVFVRTATGIIEEVRVSAGTNRSLTNVIDEINEQLPDATASVYRNTYLRLTTNDFSTDGDINILTADLEGQKLGFPLATIDLSILSHLPFAQSRSEVGTPLFASGSYVSDVDGDLLDGGGDDRLAFTAENSSNISDAGLLAYFMRRVQEFPTSVEPNRFGSSTDRHYPLINALYSAENRIRLRKNDTPITIDALARATNVVTATVASHRYAVGDLVWIQHINTADGNFSDGIFAITAVTATTFSYADTGPDGSALEDFGANLWDGTWTSSTAALGDGVVLTSPFAIGPRDSLNFTLNSDQANQSYSIPMRRRVRPATNVYDKDVDIEILDVDNSNAQLSALFGTSDPDYFADFWVFMRARAVSHKNATTKSVIWRSTRFGPESNAYRISYVNPRLDDTSIHHAVEHMSDRTFNIYLYLPHGSARAGVNLTTSTRYTWIVTTGSSSKSVAFSYSAPTVSLSKSGTTVTANTGGPLHGYAVGETVYISATSDNVNYPNGAKIVASVGGGGTTFTYVDIAGGSTATATSSSAATPPDFTTVTVGDIAIFSNDGTSGLSAALGSWRVYAKTATGFTIELPLTNSIATNATPAKIGTVSNLQFVPIDTAQSKASDFVTYVTGTADIKDLITGTLLGSGSGAIDTSTQDEYFQTTVNTGISTSVARWVFTDGLNYVLSSDLAASPNTLRLKRDASTVELQTGVSFTDEEMQLVPVTAKSVSKWLSTPAISGAYVTTDFDIVGRDHAVQATSRIQGTTGGVHITGGLANDSEFFLLGSGENFQSTYGRILIDADDGLGLVGGAWVALFNSLPTPKTLPLTGANTIQFATDGTITFNTNVVIFDGITIATTGDWVTIQRVGNFMAYIFSSTANFNSNANVGNWIDFQVPGANSSNRGRRRIVGNNTSGSYKYIWVENPNAVSEIVQVTGAGEIQTYTADSIMAGDILEIGYDVGGYSNNRGTFVVTDVAPGGSAFANKIVVSDIGGGPHVFTPLGSPTAIGTANLSAIRCTETNFRLIERVDFMAPVSNDFSRSYVALYPQASRTLLDRLNPNLGATVTVLDKLGFPDDPSIGVDGYSISTGLIGQVAKVLYGDPNSPTLFPGLVAVGATVFLSGPNVKRIRISLQIRIRTGVTQSTLVSRVRAAVASEINRIPLGTSVDISRLIAAARRVQGVVSVAVLSPTYDGNNDTIAVQANEKPFVFDPTTDIAVTVTT